MSKRSIQVEEWLASKEVGYKFAEIPIGKFDFDLSQRNQARIAFPISEPTLASYVEAMKRGDEFPPVVGHMVGTKYVIIDGNHRLNAHRVVGTDMIPTYVLAKNTANQMIMSLTFEANTRHGLPNSVEERQNHAVHLISSLGITYEDTAAALNLTYTQVQTAMLKYKADKRALDMGIKPYVWAKLSQSSKKVIAGIRDDDSFVAAVALTHKATLSSTEVQALTKNLNLAATKTARAAVLTEARSLYKTRVEETGGSGKDGKRFFRPRQHLGLGLGNISRAHALLESLTSIVTPDEKEELLGRIETAQEQLSAIHDSISSAESVPMADQVV